MSTPLNSHVRQEMMDAGVWQEGHFVLSSGLHTNVKLDMERMLSRRNAMRLRAVLHPLAMIAIEREYDDLVPVPNGALMLAKEADLPNGFPRVLPAKIDVHEFTIPHPAAIALIRKAGRIGIFDDVVTTGRTPLAMADAVRRINPDVELDLLAIWRRGTLDAEVNQMFTRQTFLIEENIPAWLEQECTEHDRV